MFGISFEHILVVGVVLLIFGPRRLPELGHTMGKAIKNFKDSISGVEETSYKRIQDNAPNAGASAGVANNTAGGTPAEAAKSPSRAPEQNA
ncbi:twin-arginine translocase TatA/TatE family subunit [bacterium]|jgi:sec-independent protein translocase protein TatA|nr:twin-arginine translocase TatA/TatE family subunit [bacterium]